MAVRLPSLGSASTRVGQQVAGSLLVPGHGSSSSGSSPGAFSTTVSPVEAGEAAEYGRSREDRAGSLASRWRYRRGMGFRDEPHGAQLNGMLDAMEVPSHARQLLLQLNSQRTKGFLCDVIIVVQNALFRAHKNILAASSVYLKSLVVHDNLINLDHEMVSPGIFRIVLDFIYTGRLTDMEPATEQSFGAVLAAASYLQISDLVSLCKKKIKRNNKYCHIRTTGYSAFGKLGRGFRAATPVIQSCFSAPPRAVEMPPVEPVNALNTHCGELYASMSQGNPMHQHGLCPPERHCSPLCGLDLSKKSPNGPSSQHLSDGLHSGEPRDQPLPIRHDSPPISASLLVNHHSASYKESFQKTDTNESANHHPEPFRSSSPLEPPNRTEGQARAEDLFYRWMKHEPLSSYMEECDREKELEREGEDKADASPISQQARYPSIGSNDPDDDKSTSEETGSSEDPSPSSNMERYHCNHLGYEPETFGDNLYVCIPCGKGFPSSELLNAHVEAHNEEDLYHKDSSDPATPFLDKSSQNLGDIIRPYRCASCDKSYKDPATLRQHEKTHWLTRPYPCSICGKKFTQRGTMTRHMRSHLGLKPFACDACGMRFTRQYRLTEHMRIHSGEKPYECQVCGGKFAQQRNLISHMKMHTTGPDGKPKLDFPESVFAMAKFTADHFSHTSHFLNDPKTIESLYPLAKFTADHLSYSQEKAAEVLSQNSHLNSDSRIIERYSPA